jgi:dienelactone hydrolase
MAFASIKGERVKAIVNFAGGLGGRSYGYANRNCAPDRLVAAAAEWGKNAKYPSLWLYAGNDSFFGPMLVQRLLTAFVSSGGRVELHLLPASGNDGHFLMLDPASSQLWAPILEKFLGNLAAENVGRGAVRRTNDASGR